MEYRTLKKKYVGLDLLRILSAMVVCMFHTTIHLDCNYGILQNMSKMGAVFMTAFFMLSGFCLFANWSGVNLAEPSNVKKFWKKRFLSVAPMYFFVATLYVVINLITGKDTVGKTVLLFPIETFGIQAVFSSLFGYSHNGGTWFISCLVICYFSYPYLQEIIVHTKRRTHVLLLLLCTFCLLYSPIVVCYLHISSIYSNPFFRLLEFLIGMILAAVKKDFSDSTILHICYNWISIITANLIMLWAITLAVNREIEVGNYMLYNWICLPCFSIMLLGLSGVECKILEQSRLISYFSKITYVFFLAQLFSNNISKYIIGIYSISLNWHRILLGWSVCIIITAFLAVIEKEMKTIIHNRFNI